MNRLRSCHNHISTVAHILRDIDRRQGSLENSQSIEAAKKAGILNASQIGKTLWESRDAQGQLKASITATKATLGPVSTGLSSETNEVVLQGNRIKELLDKGGLTNMQKNLKELLVALGVLDNATLNSKSSWDGNNDYIYIDFTYKGNNYTLYFDNDSLPYSSWDFAVTKTNGETVVPETTDKLYLNAKEDADLIKSQLDKIPAQSSQPKANNQANNNHEQQGKTANKPSDIEGLDTSTDLGKKIQSVLTELGSKKVQVTSSTEASGKIVTEFKFEGRQWTLAIDSTTWFRWGIDLTDANERNILSTWNLRTFKPKENAQEIKAAIKKAIQDIKGEEEAEKTVPEEYNLEDVPESKQSALSALGIGKLEAIKPVQYLGRDSGNLDYYLARTGQGALCILRFRSISGSDDPGIEIILSGYGVKINPEQLKTAQGRKDFMQGNAQLFSPSRFEEGYTSKQLLRTTPGQAMKQTIDKIIK